MEIILIIFKLLSLTAVAWGFGTLVEAYAIRYHSGLAHMVWEKALTVTAFSNAVAVGALVGLHFLLPYKFYFLKASIDLGSFDSFFNWFISTMVANAIELSIVKWGFKIPITRMVAFITSLSNGICALADFYSGF